VNPFEIALNEPMNAEIDLIAAAPDELTALRASLAAAMRSPVMHRSSALPVDADVQGGQDKDAARLVGTFHRRYSEPFVTFLVEVNWARGRLMREYTVCWTRGVHTGETASSAASRHRAHRYRSRPTRRLRPRRQHRRLPIGTSAGPSAPQRGARTRSQATAIGRQGRHTNQDCTEPRAMCRQVGGHRSNHDGGVCANPDALVEYQHLRAARAAVSRRGCIPL